MSNARSIRTLLGWTLAAALALGVAPTLFAGQGHTLAVASAKITLAGSSNIHDWTATSADVRLVRGKMTPALSDANFFDAILQPEALETFEVSVPVNTLKSGKDGLDKNMYKALKAPGIPNITFRATRLQAGAAAGTLKATGLLKVAGVEREITFDLKTQLNGSLLTLNGSFPLLMTDYGIEAPKAMMGMLKTSPKVTVTLTAVLTVAPGAFFHN